MIGVTFYFRVRCKGLFTERLFADFKKYVQREAVPRRGESCHGIGHCSGKQVSLKVYSVGHNIGPQAEICVFLTPLVAANVQEFDAILVQLTGAGWEKTFM